MLYVSFSQLMGRHNKRPFFILSVWCVFGLTFIMLYDIIDSSINKATGEQK